MVKLQFMAAKLTFKYDREADILHIDKCPPYPEQESEELGDDIIARLNPQTGEVENLEVLFLLHSIAAPRPVRTAGRGGFASCGHGDLIPSLVGIFAFHRNQHGRNSRIKSTIPSGSKQKWYKYWEDQGLFRARADGAKPPYCIVIPPPNVTGVLHMGHALNNTMQDILVRTKRMQGFDALWMPGTDHAGIATQNVVERMLAAEGTDRHALGREAFIQRVWQWKAESGGQIINQLKRLGASCDWSRERFTLDEGLSRAVREVFVRLYEEGLIYKGDYIINWCPRCRTALADLEVEHDPHDGHLYYIRYPLADGGGHLTVATTRPETLLGDTAVAVNPEDKRYQKFHGATLRLPVLGREIPVITDSYVSLEFGTGALKITPAHDFNDFEVARRHNLPAIQVIDEGGKMSKEAGPKYVGMDRFVCREQIVKDLKKQGLLEKVEPYQVPVGHCYRCKVIVEPLVSKQWFVAVKTLAEAAMQAVRDGRTKLIPANWDKSYFDWMTNIRDWCISRQIWWGHRIPAWTCKACGQVIVSREDPAQCPKCRARRWSRKPTSSTPGSLRPSGPSPPWAGPIRPRRSKSFTPPASWSPPSTSSFSGWPA